LLRAALYAAILAGVWVVLAWTNDRTTFHPAPLLVSLVVPLGVGLVEERPPASLRLWATVGGALEALAATTLLAVTGHLEGGSLLPTGGAVTEAVAFSLAGAAIGFAVTSLPPPDR
jgi:hypothetical protein